MEQKCYCGSGKSYENCCKPFLEQGVHPQTAEALMRSRYSAYVLSNDEYLGKTWLEATRPGDLDMTSDSPDQWNGLEIIEAVQGGINDTKGEVEFIARFTVNGKTGQLHERSSFVKEKGIWYYQNGESVNQPSKNKKKVGRNTPCPCGSGKKYKKCCGP